MNPFALLTARVRGFRVLDVAAVALILTIAVGSYAFKTFAGAEDADATGVETRIVQEQKRIRLLRAELTRLDNARRVETLSGQYLSLGPVAADHEVSPEALAKIAVAAPPPAPAAGAPTS